MAGLVAVSLLPFPKHVNKNNRHGSLLIGNCRLPFFRVATFAFANAQLAIVNHRQLDSCLPQKSFGEVVCASGVESLQDVVFVLHAFAILQQHIRNGEVEVCVNVVRFQASRRL